MVSETRPRPPRHQVSASDREGSVELYGACSTSVASRRARSDRDQPIRSTTPGTGRRTTAFMALKIVVTAPLRARMTEDDRHAEDRALAEHPEGEAQMVGNRRLGVGRGLVRSGVMRRLCRRVVGCAIGAPPPSGKTGRRPVVGGWGTPRTQPLSARPAGGRSARGGGAPRATNQSRPTPKPLDPRLPVLDPNIPILKFHRRPHVPPACRSAIRRSVRGVVVDDDAHGGR